MGGIAITQAAENCPQKIRALVVYVRVFASQRRLTITWASQDRESMVNPSTTEPRADGGVNFKLEYTREAFCGNCMDQDAEFGQSHLSAAIFRTVNSVPRQ
jgi:hypothetical protein